MITWARPWILAAGALLATGCASLRNGGAPDPAYSVGADMKELKASLGSTASVAYYNQAPGRGRRDAFINARIALADLAYLQFVNELTVDKQNLDAGSDVATMGLGIVGTLLGGARSKANLAAASTAIAGSKTTVDKYYYFERTTTALITTMNAKRKEVLARIIEGVKLPLESYTFQQALTDTHAYYEAGTLNTAVTSLQSDASAREARADRQLQSVGDIRPLSDTEAQELKAAAATMRIVINSGDLGRMQRALQALGLPSRSTVPEAAQALEDNFRRVLTEKPHLASAARNL